VLIVCKRYRNFILLQGGSCLLRAYHTYIILYLHKGVHAYYVHIILILYLHKGVQAYYVYIILILTQGGSCLLRVYHTYTYTRGFMLITCISYLYLHKGVHAYCVYIILILYLHKWVHAFLCASITRILYYCTSISKLLCARVARKLNYCISVHAYSVQGNVLFLFSEHTGEGGDELWVGPHATAGGKRGCCSK
jgi:hypothetical protein